MSREKPLILVVDDQATIIRIMSNMLQPTYDVCVATGGEMCVQVAKNQQPDLILLDNVMPGMTGVEACMLLKEDEDTKNIPVIFVTSMDDKHNESVGFSVGAVDYINKPPSPEIVMARVKVHLQNNQLRRFVEAVGAGELEGDTAKEKAAKLLK